MTTSVEQYLPKTPHPETGEPFTQCAKFEFESGQELVQYMVGPPERPQQLWFDSDADEYIELTKEEFTAALAEYEAAHARWVAAGSPNGIQVGVVKTGPSTMTGTFRTASGATAKGIRQTPHGDWHWVEYTS